MRVFPAVGSQDLLVHARAKGALFSCWLQIVISRAGAVSAQAGSCSKGVVVSVRRRRPVGGAHSLGLACCCHVLPESIDDSSLGSVALMCGRSKSKQRAMVAEFSDVIRSFMSTTI